MFTLLLFLLNAALAAPPPKAPPPEPAPAVDPWKATLDDVAKAVVGLRVVGTRSFDTEGAGFSVGTGFIVDAERGIILTNRHMVHAGPVVAEAVLLNNEEIPLQAIYRDPVHDFGFYRFDPKSVRYQDFEPLELYPEGAVIGTEIRVVGNDAGEKISFLDGTLSRLDRPAPDYGPNGYNDFNTFYIQAASGTSGGSSGSPVVDVQGRVVALNAGARRNAATSFYLPLERVERALVLIQQGQPVPRGTVEAVFHHTPYDELRRLGLSEETEARIRAKYPDGTGMLVVDETVPGGAAFGVLMPGDVVVTLDGELLTTFLPLEARLDDRVGQTVTFGVERGGKALSLEMKVEDLHAVSPDDYLEVGGGVLHDLSFQQARNYAVAARGVYVATPGYMLRGAGIGDGAILTAVAGEPTPDLAAFEAALARQPHGARVPIRYFPLSDPRQDQVAVVTMDRLWFPMQRCVRDDATGDWPCVASPLPPESPPAGPIGTADLSVPGDRAVRKLALSLVSVEFDVPYRTEGVSASNFSGAGLVVDAEKGLVVCDRDTVPVGLGDLFLVFGGSVRVPARVEFVHPEHNFVVLSYDPTLIGDTPVRSADLRPKAVQSGDPLWLVGLSSRHQVVSRETRAGRIDPLYLALPDRPLFRETNVEAIDVADSVPSMGGVLADRRGRVVALWASFVTYNGDNRDASFRGLPIEHVAMVVEPMRSGQPVDLRTLGMELYPVTLADARDRGLSDERARTLSAHDPQARQVLYVVRTDAGAPAHDAVMGGDLLLAINDQPVTRFIEVERAAQTDSVELTLLRDGQEIQVSVLTASLYGQGVDRVVSWAGMVLHAPHREVSSQRGLEPEGVYVAWFWYGTPAQRYGFRPTRRIIEVDGVPTPDLDSFLAVVSEKKDRESVRVLMVDLDNKQEVRTLKLDLRYWPTEELLLTEDGWVRRPVAP